MKEVIRIPDINLNPDEKLVEITHVLDNDDGWEEESTLFPDTKELLYLGSCKVDGDMFAAYSDDGYIIIYKGYLNSGKWEV